MKHDSGSTSATDVVGGIVRIYRTPVPRPIVQLVESDGYPTALANDGTAWMFISGRWEPLPPLPPRED